MKEGSVNFIYGLLWSLLDRGGLLIGQLISLILFSRILSPYEFGLIAIISIFVNFATIIVDSGLMGSLIKKEILEKNDLDTLFTYNLCISIVLYIIIFIISPYVSDLYENDQLISILRVMSLSIVINSFGYIQTVILTRELKYKIQSIITLISQTIAILVSIFLAFNGFGVWSLVSLQVLHFLFNSTFLCLFNRYKPKLIFDPKSFKEQMKFGKPLLISNLIFVFNTNLSNSIIGKYYNPSIAGSFYQSSKLQLTPTGILSAVIDKVAFTKFSKISDIQLFILKTQEFNRIVYLSLFPFCIMFNEYSKKFLVFILGDKWLDSSNIFYILCLSIIPIIVKTMNRNILKSYGFTNEILKIEVFIFLLNIFILFFFLKHGIETFAYSVLYMNIIVSIISVLIIHKKFNVSIINQLKDIIKPIIQVLILLFIFNQINKFILTDYLILYEVIKFIIVIIIYIVINNKLIKKMLNDKD